MWIENLGRIVLFRRSIVRSGTRQSTPHREGKKKSHFEKFVTEGNEKADEVAKEGAMWDERFMAQARATTMQQDTEEVYAALQCAASFLTAWWRNGKTVKKSSRSQIGKKKRRKQSIERWPHAVPNREGPQPEILQKGSRTSVERQNRNLTRQTTDHPFLRHHQSCQHRLFHPRVTQCKTHQLSRHLLQTATEDSWEPAHVDECQKVEVTADPDGNLAVMENRNMRS